MADATILNDIPDAYMALSDLRHGRIPSVAVKDEWGFAGVAALKDRGSHDTRMKVYHTTDTQVSAMFMNIQSLATRTSKVPERGTLRYAQWLDDLWKSEPILAGAVYSMVAKMQSMNWKVEGGRNNAGQAARMLASARHMNGQSWEGFIGPSALDFYTQDNSVWWDAVRNSYPWGKLTALAHIDSQCCVPTGNTKLPMYYQSSLTDQHRYYAPYEYIHFASLALARETELGQGFCACSRAAKAAVLLLALYNYDEEKLANLPPEGIATVTGMSPSQFRDSVALWKAQREKTNSLTFPQVLWLVGSNPGAKIEVSLHAFSEFPESFDRATVVQQYVNTLALDFGVDAREFWSISTGALGTATESEVQHMKARGKGGGEFITMVESTLNAELPDDVTFIFDTQDVEEDEVAAGVAKAWIDAYIQLVYPPGMQTESVIDQETFKRLLADKGVLPEWAVGDERAAYSSHQIHKDELGDIVAFIWHAMDGVGRLKERIVVRRYANDVVEVLPAPVVKQIEGPNIRGKPIADDEVDRGTRVTRNSVENEMNTWGNIPELAPYAGVE